jgi:membrane associated rhomboid family serine protease
MFPLGDNLPLLKTPLGTYLLLAVTVGVWIFVQQAELNPVALSASVCELGVVPGEITKQAPLGTAIPIGPGMLCVVDDYAINLLTPLTSMFLHGNWPHLLMNALFLWAFGRSIEDSMGSGRFVVLYLVCGVAAAMAQVVVHPSSPVPMVGASGAISGVMGAYLVLYPRAWIRTLFPLFFIPVPVRAYLVLLLWFFQQLLGILPQLMTLSPDVSSGVAFWAHIGGFLSGLLLIKLFADRDRVERRLLLSRW